jgi:hypothetical protein
MDERNADGEWLYAFEDSSKTEEQWTRFIRGDAPADDKIIPLTDTTKAAVLPNMPTQVHNADGGDTKLESFEELAVAQVDGARTSALLSQEPSMPSALDALGAGPSALMKLSMRQLEDAVATRESVTTYGLRRARDFGVVF